MHKTNLALPSSICLREKQLSKGLPSTFVAANHFTKDLVRRLGLDFELKGHNGCVNCLEWNTLGSILLSGSDDLHINLWDPFTGSRRCSIPSGHTGNIFSVKFLPQSSDRIVLSGAADAKIIVRDISCDEVLHNFACHQTRIKRLAVAPDTSDVFWSASEDGTVMQIDLRDPDTCSAAHPRNVLINLSAHIASGAEAKCLAANPVHTHLLAVGANDPYVRMYDRRTLTCRSIDFPKNIDNRSQWERTNILNSLSCSDNFPLPDKGVHYFVAGHLPAKLRDYKRRYRTLHSTYVTFSPNGCELLANMGGEQVYLFDIRSGFSQRYSEGMELLNALRLHASSSSSPSSSDNFAQSPTTTNGFHTNGFHRDIRASQSSQLAAVSDLIERFKQPVNLPTTSAEKSRKHTRHRYVGEPLPPSLESLRKNANELFEREKYSHAITVYNKAISLCPYAAVLYGNRAAAYMRRKWDGDIYAALRDCCAALRIDLSHLKAHFRLCRCLKELGWLNEALVCLDLFKQRFPGHADSSSCKSLDRDLHTAIAASSASSADTDGKSSNDSEKSSRFSTEVDQLYEPVSDQGRVWRQRACDYHLRFCGHCNTTTDIKEANFLGRHGQFVCAGSDDGSFFIWEKETTNIVRVLQGDESIVNCLQPHPYYCMLATSGIDPLIRVWSPKPENYKETHEVADSLDAASANQKRMNADPLEVMLINMGYRLTSSSSRESDDDSPHPNVQCRTS